MCHRVLPGRVSSANKTLFSAGYVAAVPFTCHRRRRRARSSGEYACRPAGEMAMYIIIMVAPALRLCRTLQEVEGV